MNPTPLRRSARSDWAPRPVRMVHLGLGAFFRAHIAWYTDAADDRADWGIVAFTGSDALLPRVLTEQDCLYTLSVRAPDADHTSVVASLSAAHSGGEVDALRSAVA